MILCQFYIICK